MSLLRLLTAGKSLIGVRNVANSYRMRTENLLPKFESPKNPFLTLPKTEPLKSAPVAVQPATPIALSAPATPEPVKLETISLFDSRPQTPVAPQKTEAVKKVATQPVNTVESKVASPAPAVSVVAAVAPTAPVAKRKRLPVAEWVKKLNPLAYIPKRKTGAKSARPKAGRTPVQGELSLEKVRVVRNDLNETDLEIIPARLEKPVNPPGAPSAASPILPAGIRDDSTTWSRLTSRFFGAGTTQIR
jgi:hypothetical protein